MSAVKWHGSAATIGVAEIAGETRAAEPQQSRGPPEALQLLSVSGLEPIPHLGHAQGLDSYKLGLQLGITVLKKHLHDFP